MYYHMTPYPPHVSPIHRSVRLEPEILLVLLPRRPNRLYKRITRLTPHILHPINQIQRRHLPILTEVNLGPLPSIQHLRRPIRETNGRIERLVLVEPPSSRQAPRKQMRSHPRILLSVLLRDVDHPVHEGVPVPALVAPEEGVLSPGRAVVGGVPRRGVDEGVLGVPGGGGVDVEVLGAEDYLGGLLVRVPGGPGGGVRSVYEDFEGCPGAADVFGAGDGDVVGPFIAS